MKASEFQNRKTGKKTVVIFITDTLGISMKVTSLMNIQRILHVVRI